MELENTQNNALAKLPMLKLGEYEMWEIRIKQYFQIQDYALWEVIENGNSWARSLLLMALPNEHQLTFNQYVDAQSMFIAIKARFGGNDATKKTQKALLKQQYENFNATSSESLDSIFNRLQKLVSRLAILGVDTPTEDLNVKFLRSLPSEWDTHVVVWMNKPDFETMGLDDLYNNFKIVEQKVKRTVAANNDDKNLAFLTTSSPSSTNTINTVNTGVSTGNTKVNTASTETSTASFSDATVYAFLSTQPQGSQLVHEDLEQIHDDDLEEMDLKWNMALLSMRARKFYQRTGRKIIIDGSSTAGYDKSKVECFNCHKIGHFARECRAPRSKTQKLESRESSSRQKDWKMLLKQAMCAIDGAWVTDKSKRGFGYNAVPSPHPLILNRPTPLDLSYSGLEEFKQPEVNEYGPRDSSLKPTTVCDKESNNSKENTDDSLTQQPKSVTETSSVVSPLKVDKDWKEKFFHPANHVRVEEPKKARENTDAPIIEDWVSDDEEEVEYIPKEEKKTDVPTATKKESVKTVKPSRRSVSFDHIQYNCPNAYNHMVPRAVLMKTGLKTVKNAKPLSTVRSVNTARPFSTARTVNTVRPYNTAHPKSTVSCARPKAIHSLYDIGFVDSGCSSTCLEHSHLSDFKDFKWSCLMESQILIKILDGINMYSFDMKNIVPKDGLTCLVAKATSEESMLWHRRLGHVNFKNINKLVKENLVRDLPLKRFENDQTCVACLKGKQHRASCKTKAFSPITKPLFMLHMDLFGPTFVSSLMHKKYCLVVTDDYSRFSWVFFLRSKDETSEILKNFIKEIENLVDKKVKIIRSDNGTEFKNHVMDEFCREKGIKREYSVARTPQQNGVAERKNRTLIEAARTMLADSKLPTTFWAEAVSTACYVQNRVLVVKPHNKTPYELFRGIKPAIGFMKPFGCHVTILNTLDKLGKFDGKSDEGFFVGYSLSSKAFRVYNIRTRKVQENLHVGFLENKPMLEGNGPKWLFDLDSLTQSMNYVPVVAGTFSNVSAGIQEVFESNTSSQQDQDCIIMPIWKDASFKNVDDAQIQDQDETHDDCSFQDNGIDAHKVNTASPHVNTSSREVSTATPEGLMGPIPTTEDTQEDDQEIELGNISPSYEVSSTPHIRIHKDHPIDHVIGDVQSFVQTRRMTTSYSELGFL
ncbi:putative ribonuclease H-like domain-containing protein, partial [Tanacetum coccineum]